MVVCMAVVAFIARNLCYSDISNYLSMREVVPARKRRGATGIQAA